MIGDVSAEYGEHELRSPRYFCFRRQVVNFQNMEANAGTNRTHNVPFFAVLNAWAKIPGNS